MKRSLTILVFIFVAKLSVAQDFTSEIDFYQSAYGMEKKSIVDNFMGLVAEKATAFWEVYNAYEAERKSLGKERINNLSGYAEAYENMNDEQADGLTKKFLVTRASQEKLYKKYYGKMKKVVGSKAALQFLQLEIYLQTAISFAILESVPFIGE